MNHREKNSSDSNSPFQLILAGSAFLLIIFILFGFLHRWISPVERDLNEGEYIEKVFIEFETEVWESNREDADKLGAFEGGSVLYVIEETEERLHVRPQIISALDSVWIDRSKALPYSEQTYRDWQYEEERRRYDWNE